MKWLSPPDKASLRIAIFIDATNSSPIKLYKLIKERHGFVAENISPSLIKIYLKTGLKEYEGILNRLRNLLMDLAGLNVNVCIDYWIKAIDYTCICDRPVRFGDRMMCLENLADKDILAYCYSDSARRVTIIRFPKKHSIGLVDPRLLSKHFFTECGSPSSVANYINENMHRRLKLLVNR